MSFDDPPPDPHVTGATAEPYKHAPHVPAPQPACAPPDAVYDPGVHDPDPPAKPPPFEEIVPATDNDPPLVKDVLPTHVIVDPDASEKATPVDMAPPDIDTEFPVPTMESVLYAVSTTPVARFTVLVDVKTPSLTSSVYEFGRVNEPSDIVRALKDIVPALFPCVFAVDAMTVVLTDSVRFVTDASSPLHVNGIAPIVVMGGIQTVEPDAIVIEVIFAVLNAGVVYEQRSGNGASIVYAAVVVEAVKTPDAITVSTSLTPAAREPVKLQP